MRRCSKVFLFVLLLGLPLGCGGGDDPTAVEETSDVDGVTLAVGSVQSVGRVALEGIPSDAPIDDLRVLIVGADGVEHPLRVDVDSEGAYFVAPLHPDTPNAGGDVTAIVTDGESRGPESTLTLDPLPAAPGAFARLVDALRDMIDQRAQWAGTDIATLEATAFEDVEPVFVPLRAALGYVDGDDPGDLLSLVDDTRGFMTAEERDLLDRIFGHAPLDELVRASIDSFATAGPPLEVERSSALERRACLDLGPTISTASQLSSAMLTSALADIAINPDSAPGRTLEALGWVLTGGGVLPVYGKVFSTIGAGVAAWTATSDFFRSVYPDRFVSLSYDVSATDFAEDEEDPGTWSNVQVIAASSGWRATKSIANVVISTIGAHVSVNQSLEIESLEVLRDVAISGVNIGYGAFLDGRDGGFELCQKTWDVDITDLPWSTASAPGRRFDVNPQTRQYAPNQTGTDALRVAAQPSSFGGREIEEDTPLRTNAISVDVTPNALVVREFGETINVTATIRDAADERLYWDAEAGTWEDALGSTTPGSAVRALKTPDNPDFYPFEVKVVSLSRDGLRADGLPERSDVLVVSGTPAVTVDPPYQCIAPGETLQFTAEVAGEPDATVVWERVEGYGSIDANGLYQSLPLGTSNAVVRATWTQDEAVFGEARVDVSACNCSLDITIDGDASWTRQSSQAAYTVGNFGGLFYQFFFDFDGDGDQLISASIGAEVVQDPPEPGDTGRWRASFVYGTAGQSWVSSWDEDIPLPGVVVDITEFTASSMTGRFVGNAFQFDDNGDVSSIIGVDVEFRAGYWDGSGGNWPCE